MLETIFVPRNAHLFNENVSSISHDGDCVSPRCPLPVQILKHCWYERSEMV